MHVASSDLIFIAAKRTAFGTFNGALKDLTATELGVIAAKATLAAGGVDPAEVDQVIFGNVIQTSADAIYLARHIGLRAGCPIPSPALTLNRLCGSGFQAVVTGAEQLLLGQANLVLCGGTESMTQAPHVVRGARGGLPFGKPNQLGDTLWDALTDSYTGMPMAITAEKLAEQYQLTRAECDAFALLSQQRWETAQKSGAFDAELCPVDLVSRKGTTKFLVDEHPRPQTTAEVLAKLAPVFKKDGVVTAGNASGICDGAAALVLTTGKRVSERGYKPLGRLLGWGIAGCDPTVMGIGPVPAIRRLLEVSGTKLTDYDLFDINEAFAPQYLAVEKELGLPRDRTNVCGGAIALGHPLGTSGARITAHLLHALARTGGKRAIGAACIGGGQGIAVAVSAI